MALPCGTAGDVFSKERSTAMLILLQLIGGICGIASLVCYILVIVQMFQRGKTGLAIACLLLLLLCGVGGLIAFIYGWMNANQWGIKNIMLIWTACIIVSFLCNGAFYAAGGVTMPGMPVTPQVR
jgi:hypothetical protein